MARLKTILAICLALVLVFSTTPVTWAGGPTGTNANTLPADGGDGHPWDDGTTESTPPGGTTDPVVLDQALLPLITRSYNPGAADWMRGLIVKVWQETIHTRIGQRLTGSRIERLR